MTNLAVNLREIHQASNPAHIEIEPQGTVVKMRGDHVLTTTLTPHPLLAHMDVEITGSLNITTGDIDYHVFSPISFFRPLPLLDSKSYCYFQSMNILSWNVRGAGGTDFRRVFRDMCNSYHPDLVILFETRLSGERANTIISSLGFKRFLKVDAM